MTPKNYMLGFKENVWEKCYENESMWQKEWMGKKQKEQRGNNDSTNGWNN